MSFPLANDPSWDLFYARHWLHIEIEKTWPLLLLITRGSGAMKANQG